MDLDDPNIRSLEDDLEDNLNTEKKPKEFLDFTNELHTDEKPSLLGSWEAYNQLTWVRQYDEYVEIKFHKNENEWLLFTFETPLVIEMRKLLDGFSRMWRIPSQSELDMGLGKDIFPANNYFSLTGRYDQDDVTKIRIRTLQFEDSKLYISFSRTHLSGAIPKIMIPRKVIDLWRELLAIIDERVAKKSFEQARRELDTFLKKHASVYQALISG